MKKKILQSNLIEESSTLESVNHKKAVLMVFRQIETSQLYQQSPF